MDRSTAETPLDESEVLLVPLVCVSAAEYRSVGEGGDVGYAQINPYGTFLRYRDLLRRRLIGDACEVFRMVPHVLPAYGARFQFAFQLGDLVVASQKAGDLPQSQTASPSSFVIFVHDDCEIPASGIRVRGELSLGFVSGEMGQPSESHGLYEPRAVDLLVYRQRLLARLNDAFRCFIQSRGIRIRYEWTVLPHPCTESVEVERGWELLRHLILKTAGCEKIVVDQAVRLDVVIYRLPLLGSRIDADLQSLHAMFYACGVYKSPKGR